MKAAIWYGAGRPLIIDQVLLADPQTGELEIEVAACAICHSDLTYIDGGWQHDAPAVFGHEAAGRVLRTGPGVHGLKAGDRVVVTLSRSCSNCPDCARGQPTNCVSELPISGRPILTGTDGGAIAQAMNTASFAERVLVHQSQVAKVPDQVSWTSAAVLACGVLTGYGAARRTARIAPGDTVAVIGVGGVGLNAIQGAKVAGASQIIGIDFAAERRAAAQTFGATDVVDPIVCHTADQVNALTGGRGVDKAIVCVGSAKVIDDAVGLVARGGSVVIAGMPPDGSVSQFDPSWLAGANKSILGSKFGQSVVQDDIAELCGLYLEDAIKLDELVSHRFRFDQVNEALDNARQGNGVRSVIVFDWAWEETL